MPHCSPCPDPSAPLALPCPSHNKQLRRMMMEVCRRDATEVEQASHCTCMESNTCDARFSPKGDPSQVVKMQPASFSCCLCIRCCCFLLRQKCTCMPRARSWTLLQCMANKEHSFRLPHPPPYPVLFHYSDCTSSEQLCPSLTFINPI